MGCLCRHPDRTTESDGKENQEVGLELDFGTVRKYRVLTATVSEAAKGSGFGNKRQGWNLESPMVRDAGRKGIHKTAKGNKLGTGEPGRSNREANARQYFEAHSGRRTHGFKS